jgi:transposase
MGETYRHFSREFKRHAVQLVTEQGRPVRQVARELDLHPNLLHQWRRQMVAQGERAFSGKGRVKPEHAEIRRLRKELATVKAQRDILKKALAAFAKPNR